MAMVTQIPTPQENKRPKAPAATIKMGTSTLNTPINVAWNKENSACLRAMKMLLSIIDRVKAVEKIIKERKKYILVRIKDRAGDQNSTPAANMIESAREARQVMVKQELIIPVLSLSVGRNLITPVSKPIREKEAKSIIAAIKALTTPTWEEV